MFRLTRRCFVLYGILIVSVQWCWKDGGSFLLTTTAFSDVLPSTLVRRRRRYRRSFDRGMEFLNQKTLGIRRRREVHVVSSLGMVSNQLDPLGRGISSMDPPIDDEIPESSLLPTLPSHQESAWTAEDECISSDNYGTTWTRFMEAQKLVNPDFKAIEPLLNSIAMACRIISLNLIHRAPFITTSLDRLCTQMMQQALLYTGQCHVTSTPNDDSTPSSLRVESLEKDATKFVAFITPLMVDASFSGIIDDDVLLCGSGTLFSIYRCTSNVVSQQGETASLNRSSNKPLVSGYSLYGTSTQLVVTTMEAALQGFTLNVHNQNEFICTHPNMVVSKLESSIPASVLHRITTSPGHFYRRPSPLGSIDWVEQPWISGVGHVHRALGATGGILSVPSFLVSQDVIQSLALLFERAGGAGLYVASDGRCHRSLAELPSLSTDGATDMYACYFGGESDMDQVESYMHSTSGSAAHAPDGN